MVNIIFEVITNMQTLVDLVKHSVVCEEHNIMVNIIFEMITN